MIVNSDGTGRYSLRQMAESLAVAITKRGGHRCILRIYSDVTILGMCQWQPRQPYHAHVARVSRAMYVVGVGIMKDFAVYEFSPLLDIDVSKVTHAVKDATTYHWQELEK